MSIFKKSQTNPVKTPKIDDMVVNRDYKGLTKLLNDKDNEIMRCAAVMGLAKIGDIKAVKALSTALLDRAQIVRFTAGHELMKIDPTRSAMIIKSVFKEGEYRMFELFCQELDR